MPERSYRLESLEIGAIDTYVRVTLHNVGGVAGSKRYKVTKRECPTAEQVRDTVLELYQEVYGSAQPLNDSQLANCARAAKDARLNREEWEYMP